MLETPDEAGLGGFVRLGKGPFIGRDGARSPARARRRTGRRAACARSSSATDATTCRSTAARPSPRRRRRRPAAQRRPTADGGTRRSATCIFRRTRGGSGPEVDVFDERIPASSRRMSSSTRRRPDARLGARCRSSADGGQRQARRSSSPPTSTARSGPGASSSTPATFYNADVLVMGGDVMGKLAIPSSARRRAAPGHHPRPCRAARDEAEVEARPRAHRRPRLLPHGHGRGRVPRPARRPGRGRQLFVDLATERLMRWIELAECASRGPASAAT